MLFFVFLIEFLFGLFRRLEVVQRSDGRGDFDCITYIIDNFLHRLIRHVLVNKRSDMSYTKRFLSRFEMNMGFLDSFLYPLVVTNVFIKAYKDSIGNGDFFKYEKAIKLIEEKVPNYRNRKLLISIVNDINEKGSIAKARLASTERNKFQKDLKLLRDIGINGALLDPDSIF